MSNKSKLKAVEEAVTEADETVSPPTSEDTVAPVIAEATEAELDAEEEEFRALRCDLPGVKGASAAGIISIGVGKAPPKNEFFRSCRSFHPVVPIVNLEVGMEKQYFAVSSGMVVALNNIGITVAKHMLFLTVTSGGTLRIIPVRLAEDGEARNEYDRTKEVALVRGFEEWGRMYTDQANKCYKFFEAAPGRFGEPQFPDLSHAKIFKYGFRDKGRLIDSMEHALFLKWASRDTD